MADVRAFNQHHARILTQTPIELTITDINGVDQPGASLQQAIGESSRGTADIQRDTSLNIHSEMIESRAQFVATAADIPGWGLLHLEIGIDGDRLGRFVDHTSIDTDETGQNHSSGLVSTGDKSTGDKRAIKPIMESGWPVLHSGVTATRERVGRQRPVL